MTQGSILVCAPGTPSLGGLSDALAGLGAAVRFTADGEAAAAAIALEKPRAIALAQTAPGGTIRRRLVEQSLDEWMAHSDDSCIALFETLLAIRKALDGSRCSIVLIGAGVGQTGAPGHVALATAAEGQRGLMKSIARQWGPDIRFAWASVWTPLLHPDVAEEVLPEQPELGAYRPPLGARPGWNDVARAVLALADLAEVTTGQTIMIDGGEWMFP